MERKIHISGGKYHFLGGKIVLWESLLSHSESEPWTDVHYYLQVDRHNFTFRSVKACLY